MKGSNKMSTLDDSIFGGGTIIVMFCLAGELRMLIHFFISGNWFFKIRIVLEVAVAVIIKTDPPKLLNSPELNDIIGLKAALPCLLTPQLATRKCFSIKSTGKCWF